jgi:hypothetical protein
MGSAKVITQNTLAMKRLSQNAAPRRWKQVHGVAYPQRKPMQDYSE